jgi:hypothetical protein
MGGRHLTRFPPKSMRDFQSKPKSHLKEEAAGQLCVYLPVDQDNLPNEH